MTFDRIACVEDRSGFLVPAWSRSDGLGATPVCLSPWRRAGAGLAELIVREAPVGADDLFVDLGSGDGSVVIDVVGGSGCVGVGIEAAADLVSASVRAAEGLPPGRAIFLHEVIGGRGLVGATVLYVWLLESAAPTVRAVIEDALSSSGLRTLIVVGDLARALDFGPARVIGRVQQVASRGPAGPLLRCAVSGSGVRAPGSAVDPLSDRSVSEDDSAVVSLEPGEWSDVYKVVVE